MNKQECFNVIEEYLSGSNLESRSFLSKNKEKFNEVFQKIKKNIAVLENDGIPQDYYEEPMKETLNILENLVTELPLENNSIQFCKAWCELVGNMNNNTLNNTYISRKVDFITRIIDQHLTVVEAIDIMKTLNKKMRNFKQWMPPSFEIAKHYINYLEDN